jgi:hypothetical protein
MAHNEMWEDGQSADGLTAYRSEQGWNEGGLAMTKSLISRCLAPLAYTNVRMLVTLFESCHFVPLFGPLGAACRRHGHLRKLLRNHEI